MTTTEPIGTLEETSDASSQLSAIKRFDAWMDRASERVNPILVKEARQSLKSRQFVITFSLILLFACGWTFLGVAMLTPGIYYSARGYDLLLGYYWILSFPLLLIVPYSAFRSLASEMEEGTFELLAVSTLLPRQIVGGKLASATMQIMIYLSVLAPCIAFTYLLNGVEIGSIILLLVGIFILSLLLSVFSLFLATVTKSKGWQIVVSLVLILLLAFIFLSLGFLASNLMLSGDQIFVPAEAWYSMLLPLVCVINYGVLCFYAASARITFVSENRSTTLRRIMLVQQFLYMIGFVYVWLLMHETEFFTIEPLAAIVSIVGIHWWLMGAMMTGETSQLSLRARRSLPHSTLARTLLTWFNPGPTTGFVFASLNMVAFSLFVVIFVYVASMFELNSQWLTNSADFRNDLAWFSILFACYLTFYLGLSRLFIQLVSSWSQIGPFTGILINAMLVMGMALFSYLMQYVFEEGYQSGYTLIQMPNVWWTLIESLDTNQAYYYPKFIIRFFVPLLALGMLLFHLWLGVRELSQERTEAPQRVRAEQLQERQKVEKEPEGPAKHALD